MVAAESAPGAVSAEENQAWWKDRRTRKVSAVLYENAMVRHWDHHIGPQEIHLYAGEIGSDDSEKPIELTDLTPDAGQALYDSHAELSPDGSFVVVDWKVPIQQGRMRSDVVMIDLADGRRRTLASSDDGSFHYEVPMLSPDGRWVVSLRTSRPTYTEPWRRDLWLVDVTSGEGQALSVGNGAMEHAVVFTGDSSALIVSTDCGGRAPLFRVDIDSGRSARMTDEGAWSSPQPAPEGDTIFALRSTLDEPPRAVRIDTATAQVNGTVSLLPAPGAAPPPPGRVEELTACAGDGAIVRSWLAVPEGASAQNPAPLVLWVHGGPVSSWNAWHWRWNPWLLVAQGWAVLMPDPALSSGYGQDMLERGWGQWGGTPYDDLMACTDGALERPDLDSSRTAAMGGSYGGYMANWIAGQTDRFRAIVSHASVWSLEQFGATTDYPADWAEEWGYPDTNPELYEKWSPDRYVDQIRTPMLLTHGEHDYRCPVSESLRLWNDLVRRNVPSRFLWFGAENHWILQPGDAAVWYETVLAFLDEHVNA